MRDVRQLIHIVARMPLIRLYINTLTGKSASTGIDCERLQKECFLQGIIVKILSRYLKRLISGDDVMGGNPASLRNIIVWAFIALVAAFLTHPSGSPHSMFDAPVPWPAELGLDNPGI
ncbi:MULTISPECIES: hypothetical protein [unclassified Massilia]|uniref:hypothetical protein n=1 Tax=unclassified Massilia TaxID=2609279 RepID=UPI0012E30822|nr:MULTISPECIES: hypothetical protein [unclassified Massilia]